MYRQPFIFLVLVMAASSIAAQDKPVDPIPVLQQQLKQVRVAGAQAKAMLVLADAYILKPGAEKQDMDSALLLIKAAGALDKGAANRELKGVSLILLSKLYREQGQLDTGKQSCLQALNWARQHQLPVQLAYANREIANYFSWEKPDELTAKIGYLRQAVEHFKRTERINEEAQALELLGDCLSLQGDTEEALGVLHASLDRYKASGTGDLQGVHILLGRIYLRISEYQQALRYTMAALRSMESKKDTTVYWINIYNEVGLSYSRLNDHQEAQYYFEKGYSLAVRFQEKMAELLLATNIAQAISLQGRLAEAIGRLKRLEPELPDNDNVRGNFYQTIGNIYISAKRLDSAQYYLQQLNRIHIRLPQDHLMQRQFLALATRYSLEAGQYDKLALFADSSRANSLQIKDPVGWVSSYYYHYKADSARGLYQAAIRNHVRLLEIKDSLNAQKKNRELNRLKVEFESERKDANILLLQQEQALKDLQLSNAARRMKWIVAGALLLLALLGGLYSRYRSKRRSNELLLQQQAVIDEKNQRLEQANQDQQQLLDEKEWLLREIHHRVRNNLQIVLSLLNTQSVYLDNDKAREAILQSQHRMYAMSLIHQRLYQAEHVSAIDMEPYVLDMVQYLQEDAVNNKLLQFVVSVDTIRLDAAQAVPVGLILNEAISNAIRHAFPDGRSGTIQVSLRRQEGLIVLEVVDDGIGLLAGTGAEEPHSMGLGLIAVLTRQLDGQLDMDGKNGLRVQITFTPDDARSQRMSGGGETVIVV
ncbi:histidine kinase dimerization/phosphoacceptor domain -containing protein [Paraflavitalea pollutisoli]|uniref:histidine kinase dimerization/phosphoacceptor domain -containing protein n=1 Tax=Paraflavitalea pollutisoli TaxID=3034143 RepID=UPI0023EBDCE3|nr:histidine kinase dimerization/phosphoacceptor domain -containing protein [Paraflavitalea sp. H1-2-19X]